MNNFSLLCCILLSTGLSFGQTTRYLKYRDAVEVAPKKAHYIETTTEDEAGVKMISVKNAQSGQLVKQESYKEEIPLGKWLSNDDTGQPIYSKDFDQLNYAHAKVEGGAYFITGMDQKLNFEPASFGPDGAIYEFMAQNIPYPREAMDANASGTVFLHLKIDTQGDASVLSVAKSAHPYLDYEAWEGLEKMPNWTPATRDGQPIDSYTILPVKFLLK